MSRKLFLSLIFIVLGALAGNVWADSIVVEELYSNFGTSSYDSTGWTNVLIRGAGWHGTVEPGSPGGYSARSNYNQAGYFTGPTINTSFATQIVVDFWFKISGSKNVSLFDLKINNSTETISPTSSFYARFGNSASYNLDTWYHYTTTLTDTKYMFGDFKLQLICNPSSSSSRIVVVDDVRITATYPAYQISGSVLDSVDGVKINGLPGNPVTAGGGLYSATVKTGWNGTVTPTKTSYIFDPASRTYSNVTAAITGDNYSSTYVTTYTISGSVGNLDGVTMNGLPGNPVTADGGLYTCVVNGDWSGTVTPTKAGYTFEPVNIIYSPVSADQENQNYTPVPTKANIPNPVNGNKYEPITTAQIQWVAGNCSVSHDVYVGTNFVDVSNANDSSGLCVSNDQIGSSYAVTLANNVTYYWRIDENYNNGVTTGTLKGDVWSFTTLGTQPIDPNLIGWWDFDDETAAMAWDRTGKGHHGTMVNAAFAEGKNGKAVNFIPASQGYVNIPVAAFASLKKQVTICLWGFGGDSLPAANYVFSGDNGTAKMLSSSLPWSDGAVTWEAGLSGLASDKLQKAAVAADYKGQWNHWTFTKNTTTNQMKIYLNGILWTSSTNVTKPIAGVVTRFKIGCGADGASNFYDGKVDDFRVYNRELDVNDIQDIALGNSAYNFIPANAAVTSTAILLDWDSRAEDNGALYDVYFSSDFNDVNDMIKDPARIAHDIADSNCTKTGLALDTTYYWAVDVNENGTMWPSNSIMSFKTAKGYAETPIPADGMKYVAPTKLSWTPTIAMISQDVYLGTSIELVTSRDPSVLIVDNNTASNVALGTLANDTTYYWLVDTTTSAGVNTMGVWDFTTTSIADPNLIGWWKMDDTSGAYAWDYSGHGHNGSFKGNADIVDDGNGPALNMDGSGDYITIAGYKGIIGGASRTSCAWFKTTKADSTIISWGKNSAGQQWQLYVESAKVLKLATMNSFVTGTTLVNDGQWHHVAAVLQNDGSPTVNEIKIYLDGVEETYGTRGILAINTASSEIVTIGSWRTGDYFNGKLKDVRLYDKALSQANIWTIMGIDPALDNLQGVVNNWLTAGTAGDLNSDGIVDMLDFNSAAQYWGWQD